MTPQERNILIAEAMWEIQYLPNGCYCDKYFKTSDGLLSVKKWNPSENAEQIGQIKAKLREWGCCYELNYAPDEGYSANILCEKKDIETFGNSQISESIAFLEAVGELCVELKKQK
jgi:hypothetical protein